MCSHQEGELLHIKKKQKTSTLQETSLSASNSASMSFPREQ